MILTRKGTPYLLLRYLIKNDLSNAVLVELDGKTMHHLGIYRDAVEVLPDIIRNGLLNVALDIPLGFCLNIDEQKYPEFVGWLNTDLSQNRYHFLEATSKEIEIFVDDCALQHCAYRGVYLWFDGTVSAMLGTDDGDGRLEDLLSERLNIWGLSKTSDGKILDESIMDHSDVYSLVRSSF